MIQYPRQAPSGPRAIVAVQAQQTTAATQAAVILQGLGICDRPGTIEGVEVIWKTTAGAGESLALVLSKNGNTIASFTIDSSRPGRVVYDVPVTDTELEVGDEIMIARTYVAGGTPAPIATNKFTVYWRPLQ